MNKRDMNRVAEWKRYWHQYKWEKASWHLFYNRMLKLNQTCWYCIQPKLPTNRKEANKKIWETVIRKLEKKKVFTNHKIETEKLYNPEHYWIWITYPTIEERINIMQGYQRYIQQVQDKLDECDSLTDHDTIKNLQTKLDTLKKELSDFKLLNPLTLRRWTQ